MPDTDVNRVKKRKSLGFRVKALVLSLLALMMLVWALAHVSLRQSADQVELLTEGSLPSLAATMQLGQHLESIIQSSERLMHARIQAERRVAYAQTSDALNAGRTFIAANSTFASARELEEILATLATTATDLNDLIDTRMELASRIERKRKSLAPWLEAQEMSNADDASLEAWRDAISQLLFRVALIAPDMNAREMRRIMSRQERDLVRITRSTDDLPRASRDAIAQPMNELQEMLTGTDGLFSDYRVFSSLNLRANALTRQMRVITSEMVRDLNALTSGEITKVQSSANTLIARDEQRLTGLAFAVIFAVSIAVLAFVYIDRRVIRRLKSLQDSVKDRADGANVAIPVNGNDEITEISKAVRYFVEEIDSRQQSLLESASQIHDIILQSPQPMFIASGHDILFHNSAFMTLWPVELDLRDVPPMLPDALFDMTKETRRINRHHVQISDDTHMWFDLTSSPAHWEGIPARQLILVDVTDQVDVENTLNDAKEKAEAAARAKSSFLAMMSHEIRSPMNGILSVAEILSNEKLGQEQRRLVGVINQSAETLLAIINDILDFSKIEAGKLAIESFDFNLHNLVRSAVDLFRQEFVQKGIDIDVELAPDLPIHVRGDANRIRQILFNLVGNAAKFTDAGTVSVSATNKNGMISISVTDTGIGISEKVLERLFQPFEQADSSTARQYGGTGLGLSICRQLASLLGGELTVSSMVNRGSTFTVTIPLEPIEGEAPSGAEQSSDPTSATAPSGNARDGYILVVEDNPINQMVISKILKQLGYEHAVAGDGLEALKKLEQESFSLVLTDLRMPNMDGMTLARTIRAEETSSGNRMPIVAVTADAMEEVRLETEQCGIDAFITKPIKLDEMRLCLEQHLHQTEEA